MSDPSRPRVSNDVELLAPEGLPLAFRLAEVGDRANAFLLDGLVIALILAALLVCLVAIVGAQSITFGSLVGPDSLLVSFALIAFFLVWNFYFTFFELRWNGQTPGKRRLGLRVIDARGGALSVDAIFARNLTRDLELVFPVMALMNPGAVLPGSSAVVQGLAAVWLLTLLLLPAFNVNRMRIGDLLAGTVVIALPKRQLLADLASDANPRAQAPITFTPAQLDIYGIFELQKLEEVLRGVGPIHGEETVRVVAGAIQAKISWLNRPPVDDLRFLRAFYLALRQRLERRLVLGDRKERKGGGS